MEVDQAVLNPGAVLSGTVAHQAVDSTLLQVEEPTDQGDETVNLLTNGYHHLALSDCPKQYDAILIHSDDDRDEVLANVLKGKLKSIHLDTGDQPEIALYNEVCPSIEDIFDRLDMVLGRTTLILALMTPALVKDDPDNRQTVYGTFMNFLRNHQERENCFIPVYNENPRTAAWVPALMRSNRGLDYSNFERDMPAIKKTFEFHLLKRKEREQKLRDEAMANVAQKG